MKFRALSQDPFLSKLMAWSEEKGVKTQLRAQASTTSSGKKQLKLSVYGPIGAFYFDSITDSMVARALDDEDPDEIALDINSPGGDAFMGVAIYNLLREHRAHVTVRVLGEAASAAGIISQAGDEILMGTGAMLMIHNSWTISLGDWREHKQTARLLQKLDKSQASILSSRSKLTADEALTLMGKESWFTADEAVAKGLATSTTSAAPDFEELEDEEDDEEEELTLSPAPAPQDRAKALVPSPIAGLKPIGSFFS